MESAAARQAEGVLAMTVGDAQELRRAYQAGDRAALERILTPHERPLYHLCLGILANREEAEDAVQETLLRALRSLGSFRGDSAVRTWLHRIAVNVCLEWRRARRPQAPLSDTLDCGAPRGDPAAEAVSRLHILEALATLRPDQRAALVLQAVEGYSMAEIAGILHWSPKKVENELYRARLALARWRTENE